MQSQREADVFNKLVYSEREEGAPAQGNTGKYVMKE